MKVVPEQARSEKASEKALHPKKAWSTPILSVERFTQAEGIVPITSDGLAPGSVL
jgi:hypothetical protein